MFGREDAGLPEELLYEHEERCIRIPMIEEARSLNLSNSVAIVVYEALRQQGFDNLKDLGQLTQFHWYLDLIKFPTAPFFAQGGTNVQHNELQNGTVNNFLCV